MRKSRPEEILIAKALIPLAECGICQRRSNPVNPYQPNPQEPDRASNPLPLGSLRLVLTCSDRRSRTAVAIGARAGHTAPSLRCAGTPPRRGRRPWRSPAHLVRPALSPASRRRAPRRSASSSSRNDRFPRGRGTREKQLPASSESIEIDGGGERRGSPGLLPDERPTHSGRSWWRGRKKVWPCDGRPARRRRTVRSAQALSATGRTSSSAVVSGSDTAWRRSPSKVRSRSAATLTAIVAGSLPLISVMPIGVLTRLMVAWS